MSPGVDLMDFLDFFGKFQEKSSFGGFEKVDFFDFSSRTVFFPAT